METTHVRLPAELVEQIDKRAEAEVRSRTNMTAVLLAEALKRRSQPVDKQQEDNR